MNRPTAFLFATVLTCGLAGCSVASPDAGHAGVVLRAKR